MNINVGVDNTTIVADFVHIALAVAFTTAGGTGAMVDLAHKIGRIIRTFITQFPFSSAFGAILVNIFISIPFSAAPNTIMPITAIQMVCITTRGSAITRDMHNTIPLSFIVYKYETGIALMIIFCSKAHATTNRAIIMDKSSASTFSTTVHTHSRTLAGTITICTAVFARLMLVAFTTAVFTNLMDRIISQAGGAATDTDRVITYTVNTGTAASSTSLMGNTLAATLTAAVIALFVVTAGTIAGITAACADIVDSVLTCAGSTAAPTGRVLDDTVHGGLQTITTGFCCMHMNRYRQHSHQHNQCHQKRA